MYITAFTQLPSVIPKPWPTGTPQASKNLLNVDSFKGLELELLELSEMSNSSSSSEYISARESKSNRIKWKANEPPKRPKSRAHICCPHFTSNTFLDIFQVEVLLRQDFIAGPVFLLTAGGLEALGGQVCALWEFAFQAGGPTAAAAQARLLEGLLQDRSSLGSPFLPSFCRTQSLSVRIGKCWLPSYKCLCSSSSNIVATRQL